jgi:hypothetical protein
MSATNVEWEEQEPKQQENTKQTFFHRMILFSQHFQW